MQLNPDFKVIPCEIHANDAREKWMILLKFVVLCRCDLPRDCRWTASNPLDCLQLWEKRLLELQRVYHFGNALRNNLKQFFVFHWWVLPSVLEFSASITNFMCDIYRHQLVNHSGSSQAYRWNTEISNLLFQTYLESVA